MPYFTINRKDGKDMARKESMIESSLIRRKMGKSIINLKSIVAPILRQVKSSILLDVDLTPFYPQLLPFNGLKLS